MRNGQSGRRRGRGGARPPSPNAGGRGPEIGNRIEVRQRGNAHQMLEKFKALARDATLQGDRVTAEYYMQYADHYHRVLNEHRARDENRNRFREQDDYPVQDVREPLPEPAPSAMISEPVFKTPEQPAIDEAPEPEAEESVAEEAPRRGRGRRPTTEAGEAGARPVGAEGEPQAPRRGRRGSAHAAAGGSEQQPEAGAAEAAGSAAPDSAGGEDGQPRRRRRSSRSKSSPEGGAQLEFADA